MKLDSEHLEILAAIVEQGGLTEGAEALGKSQPSVSRSVALLEARIGLPLFEPGRRPLRPPIRLAPLDLGKTPMRETLAKALDRMGNPIDLDEVRTEPYNHFTP